MRKRLVGTIALAAAIICLSGVGRATQNLRILWNRSNVSELRALTKSDVAKIADAMPGHVGGIKPSDIAQFKFADLEGNGKYELLMTEYEPCNSWLMIYWQDNSGIISYMQELHGAPNLDNSINDLNDDGKSEIIIPRELVSYDCARTFTWPAVYRLHGHKYVEASSQFPSYYQTQVIPALNKRISKLKKLVITGGPRTQLDVAVMEKDKIMRVLGWNPTAGIQNAYQWMYSDNLELATNAVATLKDIGGHENALREAEANYKRVFAKRFQQR